MGHPSLQAKRFVENLAPPSFPRLLHPGIKPPSISLQACTKAWWLARRSWAGKTSSVSIWLVDGGPSPGEELLVVGCWPQPSRRCCFGRHWPGEELGAAELAADKCTLCRYITEGKEEVDKEWFVCRCLNSEYYCYCWDLFYIYWMKYI